ncbi:MAG TPA: tripartite tricarboxylate transporter permease [Candidatus Deferrimicrobium sp.]|nr:tripartite tricarboxylate transporter permease [Candidatus Deferrimicrobium sp.]
MLSTIMGLFSLKVLIPWILAMIFGIFVGATPGLTATMAVALLIPITYYADPRAAFAMILGVSFTAIFAGDIPATFLRIPGTPASGAAVLDGFEMNKKGKGALALSVDLLGSALGGLLGMFMLILVAPFLARFALKFTNFEYFWLGVFGLSMTAILSRGKIVNGFISAVIGIAISTIGIDITTGYPRFTFGNTNLIGGISFIPVMIGLFGLSEILKNLIKKEELGAPTIEGFGKLPLLEAMKTIWNYRVRVLISSTIGLFTGALPGAGADIAAWVSYGAAKSTSKNRNEIGTGHIEGVIAPTCANNAAIGGTWIPAFVFGIPGDTITAIVLGAMLMYGLRPGPNIFSESRNLMNSIFAIGIISQIFLIPLGFLGIRASGQLLKLPKNIIWIGVVFFSIIGSYAINSNVFDIYVMLLAGLVGFFLEKLDVPLAPLILGLILGPMVEDNLRVGLIKTGGNFWPFITRPISLSIIVVVFLVLFGVNIISFILRFFKGKNNESNKSIS